MPNLKMFGAAIHDTALVFIISTTLTSVILYYANGELGRTESNICLLVGAIVSSLYWYKEYRTNP